MLRVHEGYAMPATERGREEAKLEDALRLKQLGVAMDIIAQATGLSSEVIEKL